MFHRPLLITLLLVAAAQAQAPPAASPGGIDVVVDNPGFVLFQIALPDAINLGSVPDTRGVTEALSGTVAGDLRVAAYFRLMNPKAFLVDPRQEGMSPDFKAWYQIGTQGLIKIGYEIVGKEIAVDMRLFSIDRMEQVKFPAPYDGVVKLPLDPKRLRRHAHGFANHVVKYFTRAEGFFLTQIVCVKRVGRGKELFMVSPDGVDEYRLTKNGSINMLPSLRRGQIVYTSFKGGAPHLYSLSKGKSKPLAAYKGLNTGGALSPDGGKLAVTLSKDGNPEVYLISPSDGSIIRRLTDSRSIDTSPAWSPDGSQIAFVSDRHGSPQIWIMGAHGGNPRRLTFQGEYNQTPDWSPRGDKIVFTARDERAVFDLFTVELKTGEITRLTQDQGNNEEPSYSPDGRYIVFTSTRSGESKLYIMTADGAVQTQISRGKGSYFTPSWGG